MSDSQFGASARRLAGVAAQILGWRPTEFWSATPSELEASLGIGTPAEGPPTRAQVRALMALHPDERNRADGR